MKVLDRQYVFDRVTKHLLTQMQQSTDDFSTPLNSAAGCRYRFDRSEYKEPVLSCAIGCLIDDEHYTIHLEGCGVMDTGVQYALYRSGILGNEPLRSELDFLEKLQVIHDRKAPEQWAGELEEFAQKQHLYYHPPETEETT